MDDYKDSVEDSYNIPRDIKLYRLKESMSNDIITEDCPDDVAHIFAKNMKKGISPVPQITFRFQICPNFTSSFIDYCINFLKNYPKPGQELFNYLLSGPTSNFRRINNLLLADVVIQNFPYSIDLTVQIIAHTSELKFPRIFMEQRGLVELIPHCNQAIPEVAEIFCRCCNHTLIFGKPLKRSSVEIKSEPDVNSDMLLRYEEENWNTFLEGLVEPILSSDDGQAKFDVLSGLVKQASMFHFSHVIANLIILHIWDLTDAELRAIGIEALSEALENVRVIPDFSQTWQLIPEFLAEGNEKLTDSACKFVHAAVGKLPPDIFASSDIFTSFLETASNCSFSVKNSVVSALCVIIQGCSLDNLGSLVGIATIDALIDFLENGDSDSVPGIASALSRIVCLAPDGEILSYINEYFDDIASKLDDDSLDEESVGCIEDLMEKLKNRFITDEEGNLPGPMPEEIGGITDMSSSEDGSVDFSDLVPNSTSDIEVQISDSGVIFSTQKMKLRYELSNFDTIKI